MRDRRGGKHWQTPAVPEEEAFIHTHTHMFIYTRGVQNAAHGPFEAPRGNFVWPNKRDAGEKSGTKLVFHLKVLEVDAVKNNQN